MGKMLTCLSISAIFKTLNFMHMCVKGLFCIPAQALVILYNGCYQSTLPNHLSFCTMVATEVLYPSTCHSVQRLLPKYSAQVHVILYNGCYQSTLPKHLSFCTVVATEVLCPNTCHSVQLLLLKYSTQALVILYNGCYRSTLFTVT